MAFGAKARANAAKKAVESAKARSKHPRPFKSPMTAERIYSPEESEFLRAVEAFKKQTGKRFLENCEYLYIVKSLGYTRCPNCDAPTPK